MKVKRNRKRAWRAAKPRVGRTSAPLVPLPDCLASLKRGEKFNGEQRIAALEWMQDCIRHWIDSGALAGKGGV